MRILFQLRLRILLFCFCVWPLKLYCSCAWAFVIFLIIVKISWKWKETELLSVCKRNQYNWFMSHFLSLSIWFFFFVAFSKTLRILIPFLCFFSTSKYTWQVDYHISYVAVQLTTLKKIDCKKILTEWLKCCAFLIDKSSTYFLWGIKMILSNLSILTPLRN